MIECYGVYQQQDLLQFIMGNSKGKPTIFITINKPFYLPGELVQGSVYINAPKPYPSSKILLHVSGSQKTWWKSSQTTKEKNNNVKMNDELESPLITVTQGTVPNQKKSKDKNIGGDRSRQQKIIQIDYVLNMWNNEHNLHGQYAFPFTFHLPAFLPASFKQETGQYKANISYEISCRSISPKKQFTDLVHTQQVVIRIPQKQKNQSMYGQLYLRPKSCCCCCSQGVSKIACYFQKNQYKPGEKCVAVCEIDNYKCKAKIKQIKGKFKKIVTLTSGTGEQISFAQQLNHVNFPGINAHAQSMGQNAHKISMPLIYRKSKTPIHPTTHGKLIKCAYLLQLMPAIGGCCAKSDKYFTVGLEIVQQGIQLPTIQPPPEWNPQVFRLSDFAIQENHMHNTKLQQMGNPYEM